MGNTQLTWQNPVAAGDEPVGDPCGESKHGTSSMCDDADGNQFLVNTNNAPAESEPKQYKSPSITQSESNKLFLLSADSDAAHDADDSILPDPIVNLNQIVADGLRVNKADGAAAKLHVLPSDEVASQANKDMPNLSVHPGSAGQGNSPDETDSTEKQTELHRLQLEADELRKKTIEDKEREVSRAVCARPILAQNVHRIVDGDPTAALLCGEEKLALYVILPIFALGLPVLEINNCGYYKPPIIKKIESRKRGGDADIWYQQMMLCEWDGLPESYKKAQAEYKLLDRKRAKCDDKAKKADAARKTCNVLGFILVCFAKKNLYDQDSRTVLAVGFACSP